MTMKDMLYRRSSCRSYTGQRVEEERIEKLLSFEPKPLYPDIRVRMDLVSREQVRSLCPWSTPQLLAIYSEEAPGYLENVGFLFQQVDLYLQSMGLGVCWLGLGRMKGVPEPEGMKFVILLAFGIPAADPLRSGKEDFRRKSPEQIADRPDAALEPARFAPSAINGQPWFYVHEGDRIHSYTLSKSRVKWMARIDAGIALAHLYVANPETFRFLPEQAAPQLPGYDYTGSFML